VQVVARVAAAQLALAPVGRELVPAAAAVPLHHKLKAAAHT